jgi:2-oxoglutarate ferredoxin oxidoreductase subunit alpha
VDAVQAARDEGLPVGMIRPITLWPFPNNVFQRIRRSVGSFLGVEMNSGQMQEDLERVVGLEVTTHHLGQGGGKIIYPDEVLEEIKKLMK